MPLRNNAGNPPDAHLPVLQPLLRSRASSPVSHLRRRASLFSSLFFFFCTPNRDARCSIEDSGTDHTRGCSRNVREERRRQPRLTLKLIDVACVPTFSRAPSLLDKIMQARRKKSRGESQPTHVRCFHLRTKARIATRSRNFFEGNRASFAAVAFCPGNL